MQVFLVKITNKENVDKINKYEAFTHEGIYTFKDGIKTDSFVFIFFGGDKAHISWEQGLVGFGKITKEPYDVGYDPAKPRNFKIDIKPLFILSSPIPPKETKLHEKYAHQLYDVPYVGANHFPNQAIARAEKHGAKALFSLFSETMPSDIKNLIPEENFLSANEPETQSSNSSIYMGLFTRVTKPFILLAGISGTGKSRFVREQARLTSKNPNSDSMPENFELISVRPDWHEPSDLLGYMTRLSGKPEFISTDVLRFMVKAWKAIGPTPEQFEKGKFEFKPDLRPFWLCLDEMNLAPVEQYFADYLSVLETRKIIGGEYLCDPLVKASVFKDLISGLDEKSEEYKDQKGNLARSLGLTDKDKDLFNCVFEYGIPLPYNLIVAGTVNMDETTHGFSRKVIDRALTLNFGEFYPNDFDQYGKDDIQPIAMSYPVLTHIDGELTDAHKKTRDFLKEVNDVLKGTMFELAYRALNEALIMVSSHLDVQDTQDTQDATQVKLLAAIWDDFLMMKVLPRIEGDEDKLAFYPDKKDEEDENILDKLSEILGKENMLGSIWEAGRPDLLRKGVNTVECRSKRKIEQMTNKLNRGFTSFWS